MYTHDFGRSFLNLRIDLDEKPPKTLSHKPPTTVNNGRMQIACVCTLTDNKDGSDRTYVLSESCKSEQVGATSELFTTPNADMCMVASEDEFMIVKSWARRDMGVMLVPASLGPQPERQPEAVSDVFTRFAIHLHAVPGRVLETADAIVEATLASHPLVARIEYDDRDFHVCIEHPVKAINANEIENSFQTDTGPLILPDLSPQRLRDSGRFVAVMDHAFAAFNCSEWAEFVINVPTPVGETICVNHYNKTRRIENTRNRIIDIA